MQLEIKLICDCGNEQDLTAETPFLLKVPCKVCGSILIAEFKSVSTRSEIRRRRFKGYFNNNRRNWE